MRKVILGLAFVLAASTAQAQHYRGGHGGGGNWVAPLVGGMVVGGILYGLTQPRYVAPPVYGVPPENFYNHRECWVEPAYDYYGRYIGDRRRCQIVPVY